MGKNLLPKNYSSLNSLFLLFFSPTTYWPPLFQYLLTFLWSSIFTDLQLGTAELLRWPMVKNLPANDEMGWIPGGEDLLEKGMATHSSILAWEIPWTEEPGRLQSMGSLGVGHDWATSLSLFTLMHWRRKWQPTPVFSPGKSHGQRSLVGYSLWGHKESDMTERLNNNR